jgi:hypothetical protein
MMEGRSRPGGLGLARVHSAGVFQRDFRSGQQPVSIQIFLHEVEVKTFLFCDKRREDVDQVVAITFLRVSSFTYIQLLWPMGTR